MTKSHFLLPYYKLAGREQLAAQGVSWRQVRKGVAGGSQHRGSVASLLSLGVQVQKEQGTSFKISCSVVPPVGGWYSVFDFMMVETIHRL